MAAETRVTISARDRTREAFNSVKRAMSQLRAETRTAAQEFRSARNGVIGFVTAGLGIRAVANQGRAIFDAAANAESLSNAMEAVTGSANVAAAELEFVREEATRLRQPVEIATRAFVQLTAAANGTIVQGEGTRRVFTAMSEAATVLGLTQEQLEGSFLALQQIISKGTVSAEELRGQLGERLPGAFQIAARAIGVTTAELDDLLKAGDLDSGAFVLRFADQLQKEFGSKVPDAIDSSRGAVNDFENALYELRLNVAQSGFLDGVTDAIRTITEALRDPRAASGARTIGRAIGDMIRIAANNAEHVDRLIGLMAGFSAGGAVSDAAAAFVKHPVFKLLIKLGGRAGGAALGGFLLDDVIDVTPEGLSQLDRVNAAIETLRKGIEGLKKQQADGTIDPTAAAAAIAANEAEIVRLRGTLPRRRTRAGRPSVPTPSPDPIRSNEEGATEKAVAARESAVQRMIKAAEEEAATYGKTAREIAIYRASLEGATQAELERLSAIYDRIEASEAAAAADDAAQDALKAAAEAAQDAAEASKEFAEEQEAQAEAIRDTLDPMRPYVRELHEMIALQRAGRITVEEFNAAAALLGERMREAAEAAQESGDELSQFAVQAARNIQDAIADFLVDPFEEGLDGLEQRLIQTLNRMAAEIVAAELGKKLFGDLGAGGTGSGGSSGIGGIVGDLLPKLFGFFGFAHSGGVIGPGLRQMRANLAAFAGAPRFHSGGIIGLAPDERPIIGKLGEEVLTENDPRHRANGGGMVVTMNIQTPDAESFRRARSQLEGEIRRTVERGARNT